MATLVLSTVGTILGGPIGGALGSLVGQAIDQSLFGPPARRGPRLGDLRVQTSSYGTPIPRIYGRMRVAGTVVWATDLIEEEVATGGGKGSPGAISYAYSASFAVALSSRQAQSIGRIWADGKLLRGGDGKFKSKVKFRFHDGSEDQAVDPLIAEIEGSSGSPAFRGVALAVFEDLALADYGNRIPSLTFELIADASPPRVAEIVADVSRGAIEQGDGSAAVAGFAALGSDRRSAIEPLIELWDGVYHDDGAIVRAGLGTAPPLLVSGRDRMGCSADGDALQPIAERRQEPADALPSALTIEYYDPERDYQAGQMRASVAAGRSQRRIDSAAALSASSAKSLASDALARRWAGRDRVRLQLCPAYIDLRPGQLIGLPPVPGLYRVEEVMIDGLVVIVEARRTHLPGGPLSADAGRSNSDPDAGIGMSVPLLLDLPALPIAASGLGVALAVGCTGPFKPTPVVVSANGQPLASLTISRAAITGQAVDVLQGGQSQLIDWVNSVEISCSNPGALLYHANSDALVMGANAAMLGRELIQFARADALGGGRYRLSGLLRGRRGTEWAMASHAAGEPFVILDPHSIAFATMDSAMLGAEVRALAYGVSDDEADPPEATVIAGGESLRELSPCQLRGTLDAAGLSLSWVPRRIDSFSWIDGDDPDTGGALFAVTVTRGAASLLRETGGTVLSISASELAALGSGALSVAVTELGPNGPSRLAQIQLAA